VRVTSTIADPAPLQPLCFQLEGARLSGCLIECLIAAAVPAHLGRSTRCVRTRNLEASRPIRQAPCQRQAVQLDGRRRGRSCLDRSGVIPLASQGDEAKEQRSPVTRGEANARVRGSRQGQRPRGATAGDRREALGIVRGEPANAGKSSPLPLRPKRGLPVFRAGI
jgi:hypothetical protein